MRYTRKRRESRKLRSRLATPGAGPPRALELARIDVGSGPAVLLVHGWAAFKEAWFTLPERLGAAGFRAVAVDLPGCGESPPASDGRADHLADAAALEPLVAELSPVCVVGHSMGAGPAMALAVRHPERVPRLALVAPWGVPGGRLTLAPRRFTEAMLLPVVGRPMGHLGMRWLQRSDRRTRDSYAGAVAEPERLGTDPTVLALLDDAAARLRRASRPRMVDSLRASYAADLRPLAARVRQPVLVVAGRRDPVVPPARVRRLARALPDARVRWLEGVGHIPQVEAPDALTEALLEHLVAAAVPR